MSFFEIFQSDAMLIVSPAGRYLVLVWAFLMGAIVGSFMNVVVYRLPRRMSLSHPRSRCTQCGRAIRWFDNVPIFGWLVLGGRCRDCQGAISARYPLVELLVATTSLLVAWSEMLLPMLPVVKDLEPEFAVRLGPYAFHMLLICTLYCAALIELDGHWAPPEMLGSVMIVGLILGALWPQLRGELNDDSTSIFAGAAQGAAGLLAALLLSGLAWPAWIGHEQRPQLFRALTWAAELELLGAFLGVGPVSFATVIGFAMLFAWQVIAAWRPIASKPNWAATLCVGTLVYVVAHAQVFAEQPVWPVWLGNDHDDVALLVSAGVVVAILAIAGRFLRLSLGSNDRR